MPFNIPSQTVAQSLSDVSSSLTPIGYASNYLSNNPEIRNAIIGSLVGGGGLGLLSYLGRTKDRKGKTKSSILPWALLGGAGGAGLGYAIGKNPEFTKKVTDAISDYVTGVFNPTPDEPKNPIPPTPPSFLEAFGSSPVGRGVRYASPILGMSGGALVGGVLGNRMGMRINPTFSVRKLLPTRSGSGNVLGGGGGISVPTSISQSPRGIRSFRRASTAAGGVGGMGVGLAASQIIRNLLNPGRLGERQ